MQTVRYPQQPPPTGRRARWPSQAVALSPLTWQWPRRDSGRGSPEAAQTDPEDRQEDAHRRCHTSRAARGDSDAADGTLWEVCFTAGRVQVDARSRLGSAIPSGVPVTPLCRQGRRGGDDGALHL
jgi:hypothetical protein